MEPTIVFDEVNERQAAFHRRTFLLGGFAGAGALALIGRLTDLQVVEGSRYALLSNSNQFNFRIVPPPRGRILDRNGLEIASNRPDFRVLLRRDEAKDVTVAVDKISEILPVTDDKKRLLFREVANTPKATPVFIANGLTWDEFARVSVRAPELPGISAEMGDARFYPFGGAFSHVIGYVSKISAEELKATEAAGGKVDPLMLHPGFRIGKQGVEKALDLPLRGQAGGQKVEVDSTGRVVRQNSDGDIKAVPGEDVVLTLDADIQNRALEVFGAESGAAVMMDVRSGDILCMLSAPSFDANLFVGGAPSAYYHALASYDHKPLLNKALSATYAPGSTFKTMVVLAALEKGYDPKTVHVCNKTWFWGGRLWHCDEAHGALDLSNALKTSCDIYFYQAALTIGPDRIAEVARRFGLGGVYDIDISGQHKGLVPDTAYKRRTFPKDPVWHPGETPSMGIGQGYVSVNPLQLCVMASRIANGKVAINPRLIHSVGGVVQQDPTPLINLEVDPDHIDFLRKAMSGVINDANGTAFKSGQARLDLGSVTWAGKTGTAQSRGYGGGIGVHGAKGEWILRDHAWFIAYAPVDEPRYALSVLVEHGGFGAQAAVPRAREIMKVALLKDPDIRARIETPLPNLNAEPVPVAEPEGSDTGLDAVPSDPTQADGPQQSQPL